MNTANHSLVALKTEGYFYKSKDFIAEEIKFFQDIIHDVFNKNIEYYISLELEEFRSLGVKIRDLIQNSKEFRSMQKKFSVFFTELYENKDKILSSSFVTYFPTRPCTVDKNYLEQLDLHRETFYANKDKPYSAHQINIWLPIFDVDKNQSLKFIERSHLIPDSDIKTENLDFGLKKFTNSHQLGYSYSPKKIISGVDVNYAKRFDIPKNHLVIFDGNLIHGSGSNHGQNIRHALAFGIIKEKNYIDYSPKSFRSNLPSFIDLDQLKI